MGSASNVGRRSLLVPHRTLGPIASGSPMALDVRSRRALSPWTQTSSKNRFFDQKAGVKN